MSEPKGTDLAPLDQVWVCSACGKTSRSRYGFDAANRQCASPGWDESCMMHAVLCHAEKDERGHWRAVQP